MAGPTYYYDQGLNGFPEERSLADTVKDLLKCADGGRTDVALSTYTGVLPDGENLDYEQITIIEYFDKDGNLCGKIYTPGDPFGLGARGIAGSAPPATGITEFWTATPDGKVTGLIKDMVPVDPDTFMANFVTAPTSLNAYTDFLDLTNSGCNGVGHNNNDKFDFGTGANIVTGGAGDDRLYKTASGDVTFSGGSGTDWLIFRASDGTAFLHDVTQKMVVNLATGTGKNPYGGHLTLTGVENVIGTYAADLIIGDGRANRIGGFGDSGADTIRAGGGNDTVIAADIGVIHADGGKGFDRLIFVSSFDLQDATTAANIQNFELFIQSQGTSGLPSVSLGGNADANYFIAGDGVDTLTGRGGNDTLDGGLNEVGAGIGADVAVFSGTSASYAVTKLGGTITVTDTRPGSPDGTDTLFNVETLRFADKDVVLAKLFPNLGSVFTLDPFSGSTRDLSAKDDSYYGTDGNDGLDAGAGSNLLVGGKGDDDYYVYGTKDRIVELTGEGTDTVHVTSDAVAGSYSIANLANVENMVHAFNGVSVSMTGNALANLITASAGDTLYGGAGNDTLISPDGFVFGRDVTAYGGAGEDRFNSYISGYSNDTMTGGSGADTFVFATIVTSAPTPGQPVITDFQGTKGDRIDLSRIDAVAGGADDAFVWRGAGGFTGAGQVRVVHSGGATFIEINLTGTDTAEGFIELSGNRVVHMGDLIL